MCLTATPAFAQMMEARPVKCHVFCVILTHLGMHRAICIICHAFSNFKTETVFETEFENQKKIRLPSEYYIVPPDTLVLFVDAILVSFVLKTKVTGFAHSLFSILDLGSVFYCKRAKIESAFQIFSARFIVYARHETEVKNIWESV